MRGKSHTKGETNMNDSGRRLLAVGLSLCVAASLFTIPAAAAEAPSLRQDHGTYMIGFEDGTFRPNNTLTRAETAQIIYRLLTDPTGGSQPCSYLDVGSSSWYHEPVTALCKLGLFDDDLRFRPNEPITRAELVDVLVRLDTGDGETTGVTFPDVPTDHWAAKAIGTAAARGWIQGYPDGTFGPEKSLTRAEACTVLNRVLGRTGDAAMAQRVLSLGLFSDVKAAFWGGTAVAEAAVSHDPNTQSGEEVWQSVDYASLTFAPGFHDYNGMLFYVDRDGKLVQNQTVGAYTAGPSGALSWKTLSYQMQNVPYLSQIDDIYAWVGCEAVSSLMGLQAKGYASEVALKDFLDNLPRSTSDPEKGFVGSPYVPDKEKKTRTTIYPAKLAEYCNSYCNGDVVCADFRGASVTDLQRELLAGNCVVAYETLWWAAPFYREYDIEGTTQRLVSNNHAVLVCGYDPEKGYFISDPYNYYNRGEVYQYWENAVTFETIWNERKVGMVLR